MLFVFMLFVYKKLKKAIKRGCSLLLNIQGLVTEVNPIQTPPFGSFIFFSVKHFHKDLNFSRFKTLLIIKNTV